MYPKYLIYLCQESLCQIWESYVTPNKKIYREFQKKRYITHSSISVTLVLFVYHLLLSRVTCPKVGHIKKIALITEFVDAVGMIRTKIKSPFEIWNYFRTDSPFQGEFLIVGSFKIARKRNSILFSKQKLRKS